MPTEALEQVLEEGAIAGAEQNVVEVLSRVLKADKALVARLLHAVDAIRDNVGVDTRGGAELDPELVEAIKRAVEDGLRRVRVRKVVLAKTQLNVSAPALTKSVDAICRGCPESLRCVLEEISTPKNCYDVRKRHLSVTPIRMSGDRVIVRAEQPTGTYEVSIRDFHLPTAYDPKKDRR